MIASVMCSNCN